MTRGLPSTASLPKVSFTKVEEPPEKDYDLDKNARKYGYEHPTFIKPPHYIRYIEPLESELATQVEYDMDEQDREWIDAVNRERKAQQLSVISYEIFEIVIDQFEKEFFALKKRIPKSDLALPSEDSTCSICDDAEGENSNAIVFCDGCNLAVHQDCYGVPYIPEGQWLCRKCTVSPENPVSCILCPNEGGAFKQTIMGEWAHLLCAIWIPETRVANEVFMEPITGTDRISKQRWKLKCSLCSVREGACIQCSKSSCFLAFHVTCAREEKFLMPMKSQHGTEPEPLTCYCEKHLPPEQAAVRADWLASRESAELADDVTSKSARAYAKSYTLGPPLVPHVIYEHVLNYTKPMNITKQPEFIQLLCRYWSLKREARRGAPLLKRLHLEPWTASNVSKQQTDEEKGLKLEYTKRLRRDLEMVRMLAELCKKREQVKLKQAQTIDQMITTLLFPHEDALRRAFNHITLQDQKDYFKTPVNKADVPDYYDIVKEPMCWDIIDQKIDNHAYWDVEAFKRDIMLVVDNAMLYNNPSTDFYKEASKIKLGKMKDGRERVHSLSNVFIELDRIPALPLSSGAAPLEPPLGAFDPLFSTDAIQDDADIIVEGEPWTSLFNYELAKMKPRPPSPPPKTKAQKRKKASRPSVIEVPPADRPRTRGARAAEADPDAEVTDRPSERRTRKKPTIVLPGQGDTPPVVDDVDKREAFKRFDHGWILPAEQRRHGRAAPQRGDFPPPKKRIRTGPHGDSRLSVSTPASENRTLEPKMEEMDDDTSFMEEIDTPANRRRKHMEKKMERAKIRAEPESGMYSDGDEVSDLSALTELETDEDEEGNEEDEGGVSDTSTSAPSASSKRPSHRKREPGKVMLKAREMLEGGTLVWAKVESFPWWPGVVFEEDDHSVPDDVLSSKAAKMKEKRDKRIPGPLHLIQFYDRGKTWGWVNLTQLLMLGEDDDCDAKTLNQRYRTDRLKTDCRAAYRQAKAEMETPEEADEAETETESEGKSQMEVDEDL